MEILNFFVGLVAAVASVLAARLAWKQLQRDRDARAGQLKCRLLFDDGLPAERRVAPHLLLSVENAGSYAVRIVRPRLVLRRAGGFVQVGPLPGGGGKGTVAPGTVAEFAFFDGLPGVELEPAAWKRLTDEEPFECAFVEIADGRVFFAVRNEADEALKLFHAAWHDG